MHSDFMPQAALTRPARRNGAKFHLRLRGGLIAAACWSMLLLGRLLTPLQCGYGTHEQLGLPACSFMMHWGIPCPTCGLTTSFSAAAHGRVTEAFTAHPFGVVLFAAVIFSAVAGFFELLTGRNIFGVLRTRPRWLWAVPATLAIGWGLKLTIAFTSGQLPAR